MTSINIFCNKKNFSDDFKWKFKQIASFKKDFESNNYAKFIIKKIKKKQLTVKDKDEMSDVIEGSVDLFKPVTLKSVMLKLIVLKLFDLSEQSESFSTSEKMNLTDEINLENNLNALTLDDKSVLQKCKVFVNWQYLVKLASDVAMWKSVTLKNSELHSNISLMKWLVKNRRKYKDLKWLTMSEKQAILKNSDQRYSVIILCVTWQDNSKTIMWWSNAMKIVCSKQLESNIMRICSYCKCVTMNSNELYIMTFIKLQITENKLKAIKQVKEHCLDIIKAKNMSVTKSSAEIMTSVEPVLLNDKSALIINQIQYQQMQQMQQMFMNLMTQMSQQKQLQSVSN